MWQGMSKRDTFYEDEDFKLSTEEVEGELFVHLIMEKATRKIIDRIMFQFAKLKAIAYFDGREAIYTYTEDDRFLRLFFAEELGEVSMHQRNFKVGKWDLNSY